MNVLQGMTSKLRSVFMMIAEPRVTRLLYFIIYMSLLVAGILIIVEPPSDFQDVIGSRLVDIFGGFIALGAIFCAFSVLPGIWWLERVGIFALVTGLGVYFLILVGLQSSPIGFSVSFAFLLTFVLRWLDIHGAQLAPREE